MSLNETALAVLTGRPALCDLFEPARAGAIDHIAVADRANLLVIAPATANIIAKIAHGIADDALSTLSLATRAPVLIAPAMNVNMWRHPATQDNVRRSGMSGIESSIHGSPIVSSIFGASSRIAVAIACPDSSGQGRMR
jgi:phosphopantothenoylcysteine decarboxylase/phosphopantothenate--cysteine ligase